MEQLYVFGTGHAAVTRCYNTCFAVRNPSDCFFMVDAGGGNGILRILEDMKVSFNQIHHIFITHELTSVTYFCDQVLLLYQGTGVEHIAVSRIREAKHPYAVQLLSSVIEFEGDKS